MHKLLGVLWHIWETTKIKEPTNKLSKKGYPLDKL